MVKNIGYFVKHKNGRYTFHKDYFRQGWIYKYMGNLDEIDDDYPIYSSEYQKNGYETKSTLRLLCEGTNVDWRMLFLELDWAHADSVLTEMVENMEKNGEEWIDYKQAKQDALDYEKDKKE